MFVLTWSLAPPAVDSPAIGAAARTLLLRFWRRALIAERCGGQGARTYEHGGEYPGGSAWH